MQFLKKNCLMAVINEALKGIPHMDKFNIFGEHRTKSF